MPNNARYTVLTNLSLSRGICPRNYSSNAHLWHLGIIQSFIFLSKRIVNLGLLTEENADSPEKACLNPFEF